MINSEVNTAHCNFTGQIGQALALACLDVLYKWAGRLTVPLTLMGWRDDSWAQLLPKCWVEGGGQVLPLSHQFKELQWQLSRA